MILRDYPMCCGINMYTQLEGQTPEDIKKALESAAKSRSVNYVGMNLIAINDGMKLQYHDILEECGWRLIVNGAHNHNHDSRIYLYCNVFRPEMSEPALFPAAESDY